LYAPKAPFAGVLMQEVDEVNKLLIAANKGKPVELVVVLSGDLANDGQVTYLLNQRAIKFIKSADINRAETLSQALNQAQVKATGKLRYVKHRESSVPVDFERALVELGQNELDRNLAIEIIILTAFTLDSLSIKIGISDLDDVLRLSQLVATQA
jgi:hypothetical protein